MLKTSKDLTEAFLPLNFNTNISLLKAIAMDDFWRTIFQSWSRAQHPFYSGQFSTEWRRMNLSIRKKGWAHQIKLHWFNFNWRVPKQNVQHGQQKHRQRRTKTHWGITKPGQTQDQTVKFSLPFPFISFNVSSKNLVVHQDNIP